MSFYNAQETIIIITLINVCITPEFSFCPFTIHPRTPRQLLSITIGELAFSRILYQQNHLVYIFCLSSFSQHKCFYVFPYTYMYQQFSSYCWVLFQCMTVPQFAYLFSCWTLGLFLVIIVLAIMKKTAICVSLCVNKLFFWLNLQVKWLSYDRYIFIIFKNYQIIF